MPPILLLLTMTFHVLLCGLCWVLLRCFAVWWNRSIRKSGLVTCCVFSVFWGSWRRCVPPVSCHLHWMWGRLLLVLQFNQVAVGSVTLCLPLVSLTVKQLHWSDIIKYCLLIGQGIGISTYLLNKLLALLINEWCIWCWSGILLICAIYDWGTWIWLVLLLL